MFLFNDVTFVILLPALILAMYAQGKVSSTFNKYNKIRSSSGLTGEQVARRLLDSNGLGGITIEGVKGTLTDHYDPKGKVLRLSPEVYSGDSLASFGVAAHETGHALQDAAGYVPLGLRNNIFPVAALGSRAAMPLFLLGFFFPGGGNLMLLGIFLFAVAVIFQVVTLPVEFNASSRALTLLREGGYLEGEELTGAKRVLDAAALTYLAAALMAVLQLARLLLLRGRRND